MGKDRRTISGTFVPGTRFFFLDTWKRVYMVAQKGAYAFLYLLKNNQFEQVRKIDSLEVSSYLSNRLPDEEAAQYVSLSIKQ